MTQQMISAVEHVRQNREAQRSAMGSFRGVGYSTQFRKFVAEQLVGGMTIDHQLLPHANNFAVALLKEGLHRSTLTRWVENYTKVPASACFIVAY